MSTYTIRSGDTLSSIASRHKTSVSALLKSNPSIKNANVIFTGKKLVIPGSKDEFTKPGASSSSSTKKKPTAPKAGKTHAPSGDDNKDTGGSEAAYRNARSVLGHNISQLKHSGPLSSYLDKWPSNRVCCANFVSACLDKAGQIKHSEHNDNVRGLANNLSHDSRWSKTSLEHAKPGDVVCFDVPGEGHYGHVVLFAGWKNGSPQFIGSNNANPDGTQRITMGHMGYKVDAVFHYKG